MTTDVETALLVILQADYLNLDDWLSDIDYELGFHKPGEFRTAELQEERKALLNLKEAVEKLCAS